MIHYKKGNLLDVTEGVIVHGCNTQGVMGSGVALAVKNKYPDCYLKYHLAVKDHKLGDIIWWHDGKKLEIANGLTQENFGRDPNVRYANYTAIAAVFRSIANTNKIGSSPDVHFPKIGAGLGNGDWNIIEQLINDSDPKDTFRKICWIYE